MVFRRITLAYHFADKHHGRCTTRYSMVQRLRNPVMEGSQPAIPEPLQTELDALATFATPRYQVKRWFSRAIRSRGR